MTGMNLFATIRKWALLLLTVGYVFSLISCDEVSRNVVEISVDFSWEGINQCGQGNPNIYFSGAPEGTVSLIVTMYDHGQGHDIGWVKFPYTGDGKIAANRFTEIQAPCPAWGAARYEVIVEAVDVSEVIIGKGSRQRLYPEEE